MDESLFRLSRAILKPQLTFDVEVDTLQVSGGKQVLVAAYRT
jgi:hypothetical protein